MFSDIHSNMKSCYTSINSPLHLCLFFEYVGVCYVYACLTVHVSIRAHVRGGPKLMSDVSLKHSPSLYIKAVPLIEPIAHRLHSLAILLALGESLSLLPTLWGIQAGFQAHLALTWVLGI